MTDQVQQAKRDKAGKFTKGGSGSPATQWGPDNPPPRSLGRPKKDAWLKELELRLEDPRVRQALADKLLKIALKGGERASLRALSAIQDRVGGPIVKRVSAEMDVHAGVLVAPARMSPQDWIESSMKSNAQKEEPGKDKPGRAQGK